MVARVARCKNPQSWFRKSRKARGWESILARDDVSLIFELSANLAGLTGRLRSVKIAYDRLCLRCGCQWRDLHRWPRRAARWVLVPRDPAYRRPRCPSRVPAPVHRSPAASICTLTWEISSGRVARCRTLTTMSIAATMRKSTPRRIPARSTRSTLRSVPFFPERKHPSVVVAPACCLPNVSRTLTSFHGEKFFQVALRRFALEITCRHAASDLFKKILRANFWLMLDFAIFRMT